MTPEQEAVLRANGAFYDAFARGDLDAMNRLWAERAEVACIHPGWRAIVGRDAVMASWQGILEGPDPPEITCSDPRVLVHGDSAAVLCTERLPGGELVATNLFVREADEWRIVHHHAGPAPPDQPETDEAVH